MDKMLLENSEESLAFIKTEKKNQKKSDKKQFFLDKLKKKYRNSLYHEKGMMKARFENAQYFINVKEVDDAGILHLKSGEVASILSVDAIDLSLSSNEEKSIFFNMFRRLYQINNMTLKQYKLDKPINLNLNKEKLRKVIESLDGNDPRRNLLIEEYNTIGILEENYGTISSSYYFVIITSDIPALEKKRQEVQNLLDNMIIKLNTTFVNNRLHIYKILSNLYICNNSLDQIIWGDVTDLLAPLQATENQLSIKKDDEIIQCVSIKNVPRFIEEGFFEGLFNIPNVRVSITIKDSLNQQELSKWIDNQYKFLMVDRNTTNNLSDATDIDNQQQNMQLLMNDIKVGDEKIKEVSVVLLLTGNKKERESSFAILKDLCNIYQIKIDVPKLRQLEAWQSYDITSRSFVDYNFYLPTRTLSVGFPFTKNHFNDENGFLLGEDVHTGLPTFFDPFVLNSGSRTSHNIAIVGTTGAGKSFTMKKLLIDEYARGTKILIFDAENEYENIVKQNGGEYINLFSSEGGIINPLQIRFLATEDTENNEIGENSCPMDKHLGFLEVFFKTAFEDITEKELVVLLKILEALYKEKGITKETTIRQLETFSPQQFPIFSDLVKFIPEYAKENSSDVEKEIIEQLKLLVQRFQTGNDANLFNNYTNINLDNDMIAFNLQELLYSDNRRLINTQILNLLSFINNAVVQNKMNNEGKNDNEKSHILIEIDEFHLFIDEENPIILKHLSQLARRIRKYSGSLVVTTQSIKDFVNKNAVQSHAQAIFNNCQYQFVGMLKEADLLAYVDLFKNNPLTETQQEFLLQAQQGQFLVNIESKVRLRVKIFANDLEKKQMGEIK